MNILGVFASLKSAQKAFSEQKISLWGRNKERVMGKWTKNIPYIALTFDEDKNRIKTLSEDEIWLQSLEGLEGQGESPNRTIVKCKIGEVWE
jgi:hypothetical protein